MNHTPVIGIMGGSFDPVHIGHLILASYVAQWCGLDEVWLSLSPANPLKGGDRFVPDYDRLEMLKIGVGNTPFLKVCDIELSMPRPSYTINTLELLRQRYPEYDFRLIIGSDNLAIFDSWRDSDRILDEFGVIVYPRKGYETDSSMHRKGLVTVDAPEVEISSTFVRKSLKEGRDMNFFLPPGVYDYIKRRNLYNDGRKITE